MRRPLGLIAPPTALTGLLTVLALLTGLPTSASSASSHGSSTVQPKAPAATHSVVLRPVTASGVPARGWSVTHERGRVTCSGTSPSATAPDIVSCYPTAFGLRACWKSARHTVLCVRDARANELVRIHYRGRFPRVHAPAEAAPIRLVLTGGRECRIRVGGAWGAPNTHPQWVGFYGCRSGGIYGPGNSTDAIIRTKRLWSVRVWRNETETDQPADIVRRGVRTAYYVGTAA